MTLQELQSGLEGLRRYLPRKIRGIEIVSIYAVIDSHCISLFGYAVEVGEDAIVRKLMRPLDRAEMPEEIYAVVTEVMLPAAFAGDIDSLDWKFQDED